MDYFAALYKIYFLDLSFVRIIWWEQNDVLFRRLVEYEYELWRRFKNKNKIE